MRARSGPDDVQLNSAEYVRDLHAAVKAAQTRFIWWNANAILEYFQLKLDFWPRRFLPVEGNWRRVEKKRRWGGARCSLHDDDDDDYDDDDYDDDDYDDDDYDDDDDVDYDDNNNYDNYRELFRCWNIGSHLMQLRLMCP